MLDKIIAFFNTVTGFFSDVGSFFVGIWDFMQSGLYDVITEWFAAFVIWSTVAMLKFKLMMVVFAWDVAQEILEQLNISSALASIWSQLDSDVLNALTFFNVPEAISIILSARLTRFVLNFIGL